MWIADAVYSDGTEYHGTFPYHENGNYGLECSRQYDIECFLIERHPGCTFYSVSYAED